MSTWTWPCALSILGLIACTGPNPMSPDGGGSSGDGPAASCGGGCGANQVCDNGTCKDLPQTCPCPKLSYCDVGSNSCKAGCLDDTQCNAGQYCDTGKRQCLDGCNKDAMCPSGDVCVDHACRAGCRSSSACPGSTCNMTTFSCECTAVTQLYCPMDKKCTTHDGVALVCDVKGAKTRGQACTGSLGVDDCAAGLYCKPEGMVTSLCRQLCKVDADCGGSGSFCDISLSAGTGQSVCSQPCTGAYPGSGCPTGLGCYTRSHEHTDCEVPGAAAEGAACTSISDCKPGLACITGPSGASKCRRVCNQGDNTICGAGGTCIIPSSGGVPWVTYGVCCPSAGC